MSSRTRKILRCLGLGLLATTVTVGCLTVAAVSYLKQAVSRIEFDNDALAKVIEDAMLATLREGTPHQKIEIIASFSDAPPDSASYFRPLLAEAAKDQDAQVRMAAIKALERFDSPGSKAQP